MTRVDLVSAFWIAIFGGILVVALLSALRMKLDEQRRRERHRLARGVRQSKKPRGFEQ